MQDVLWHHLESIGSKAYTYKELRAMLAHFEDVQLETMLTPYDTNQYPRFLTPFFPAFIGTFVGIRARKSGARKGV